MEESEERRQRETMDEFTKMGYHDLAAQLGEMRDRKRSGATRCALLLQRGLDLNPSEWAVDREPAAGIRCAFGSIFQIVVGI